MSRRPPRLPARGGGRRRAGRWRLSMRFFSFGNSTVDTKHSNSIQLKLHDINRLFNSMDPSPFIEKDLDDDAEEFIVSWAQEFSPASPVKLKIYLEQWPPEDPSEMIRHAVHFYFAHRTQMAALDFKRLMKQGRTSLLIGLVFLVACLAASKALLTGQESTWASTLRESLTIAGWVAMWRPCRSICMTGGRCARSRKPTPS